MGSVIEDGFTALVTASDTVAKGSVQAVRDIGGGIVDTGTNIVKNVAGITQLDESIRTVGSELGRGANDVATDLDLNTPNKMLNAYTNYLTGGIFGVDENNNLKQGALTRLVDEGLGELTGRNAQREANARQQEAIDAAKAAQQAEIAAENKRKEQIDVASSKAGGLARQSALSNYGVYGSGSSVSPLQNPSKDFMGL